MQSRAEAAGQDGGPLQFTRAELRVCAGEVQPSAGIRHDPPQAATCL